uniref:glycine dehydrogenase (aminomethyl-transferring) n=1 Tax=Lactuca sativa TaxID=4236 RepID=A0A9R1UHP3_LACSA|nr:hypothetical protein LSAT_V11C900470000 [Lactuca sativa]
MIPLGSCTMKLNATTEMMPVTWQPLQICILLLLPNRHRGFRATQKNILQEVFKNLGDILCTITGFDSFSLQPNVGAAGEYECTGGLTSPWWIGVDVCHLNLHKTFCVPHGGGGPEIGPIGVKKHLAPYLPSHPVSKPLGTVSAAPWGSTLILPISYTYIAMMGSQGLTYAYNIPILNANYLEKRLESHYPILFRGVSGTVAHEFIVDLRPLKTSAGIEPEDVAKRLIDYRFYGLTMSCSIPGTLMIEPTESESKAELDRFCDALISIRQEIAEIEKGTVDINNNVIKGAPHPPQLLMADKWTKPYSREYAAYPAPWLRRVDNVYGDRNPSATT